MNLPALHSSFFTPKVLWYQKDTSVTLRIMLADVDDYFLLVDQDHLRFSTTVKERHYYLCIYLFGAVIPEKCTHRNVHVEIRVILPKAHKCLRWLRLCLEKSHNHQIVQDPDKLDEDAIVLKKFIHREWDDWEEYKRQHDIVNILPASHSTDESESDDEVMDALIDDPDFF